MIWQNSVANAWSLLWQLVCICIVVDSVTLGPVEVIRNTAKVNCGPAFPPPHVPGTPENIDIPDEPCRAWFHPNGTITMLSTHTQARLDHGPALDKLHHDCRPVFNSTWDQDPAAFDDRTWLMSPWVPQPGAQTIYALAHMEFHGFSDTTNHSKCIDPSTGKPYTKSPEPLMCWYNAIVLLKSVDGGQNFQHALPPPQHLVASAPYRYPDTAAPGIGYGDMSNILQHESDGFLYIFANSRHDYLGMKRGHCLLRTKPENLYNPKSWRAWGGSDFNITFINPYTNNTSVDPAKHACTPVDSMVLHPSFIGYSTHHSQYIAVGQAGPNMVFSLSENLIDWNTPTVLRHLNTTKHVKEAYATLLDPTASSGRGNVDRVGQSSSYLYYMHSEPCNQTSFACRDIWRQSVSFK